MAPSASGMSRPPARSTGSSLTDPSNPWPSRPWTFAHSSGSDDKSVRLWDFWGSKGKQLHQFDGPAAVLCVAFSPDGHNALSGGSDGALTFWDLDRLRELERFEGPQDRVRCVAFFPDGRHALSGTEAGKIIVWDLENRREVNRFKGKAGHLGIAVLPDGRHALTADDDGFVRRWKLPDRRGEDARREGRLVRSREV